MHYEMSMHIAYSLQGYGLDPFPVAYRLNFLPGLTAALTNEHLTALTTT